MEQLKFESYMIPTLEIMSDRQIRKTKNIYSELIKKLNLTDEVLSDKLPSGRSRCGNRMHWAITYLKFAGLLIQIKFGELQITNDGIKALEMIKEENLKKIDTKWLSNNFPKFNEYLEENTNKEDDNSEKSETNQATEEVSTLDPIETINSKAADIKKAVCEDLLSLLKDRSSYFFEEAVVKLVERMGYGIGKNTPRTRDGGIDGIIEEDKLGLGKIYIQAKKYDGHKVSRPEVQRFSGALDDKCAQKGIFITTEDFSDDARNYNPHNKNIVLIDGHKLVSLMYDYDVGVDNVQQISIKRVNKDFFDEE